MQPDQHSEDASDQAGDERTPNKRRRIAVACNSCRNRKSRARTHENPPREHDLLMPDTSVTECDRLAASVLRSKCPAYTNSPPRLSRGKLTAFCFPTYPEHNAHTRQLYRIPDVYDERLRLIEHTLQQLVQRGSQHEERIHPQQNAVGDSSQTSSYNECTLEVNRSPQDLPIVEQQLDGLAAVKGGQLSSRFYGIASTIQLSQKPMFDALLLSTVYF